MAYKDKEKLKEYQKQYRENNKERLNKLKKEWRDKNSEQQKLYRIEYRAKNNDILNAKDKKRYYKDIDATKLKRKKRYWRNKEYNPEKIMFQSAKDRAKRKGLEFTITLEDIKIPKACPIFGLTLSASIGRFNENSPSLDRINNSKGYVKGNIIVISYRANQIKNDATPDELMKIGLFFKKFDYDFSSSETIEKLSERYDYQ